MTPMQLIAAALALGLTPLLLNSSSSSSASTHLTQTSDPSSRPARFIAPSDGTLLSTVPELHFEAGQAVAMQSALSHGMLLEGGKREVYYCVNLLGGEQVESLPRPGLSLALVIDRSGSMASERKLEFAKSAAFQFVNRLEPKDSLAIITYDDQIETLVPSQPVTNRNLFRQAITSIESGNSTNLYGGMMAGYDELRANMEGDRMSRVLLLSDGLATTGVQDAYTIASHAESCAQQGVRISTMGMGIHYDDALMQQIAKRSGGNYSFVGHPEEVGAYLENELDELGRVVARNPMLRIRLGKDVDLLGVLGYESRLEGRILSVPIPDLQSGELRKVIVRMHVAGEATTMRTLAQAKLEYQVAATQLPASLVQPARSVGFTRDYRTVKEARNLEVLSLVEVSVNGQAMLDAMDLQKQGDYDAAMELLGERYRQSALWNASTLRSLEVQRTVDKLAESKQVIESTRYDPEAGRYSQLQADLASLGYIE